MRQRQPIPPKATFSDGSPFERLAKTMRALIGVPKRELEEMLAQERADKPSKRKLAARR